MSCYHASIKPPITKKSGKSLVTKAAYNGRTQLRDPETGLLTKDYSKGGKEVVLDHFVVTPIKASDWIKTDLQKLIEASLNGNRSNAREGQEIILGFIHELSLQRNKWMLNDFIHEQITRKTGHTVIVDIHSANEKGDERNTHAHLILLPRQLNPDGTFGKPLPALTPQDYDRIRGKWAEIGAKELIRDGLHVEAGRYRWGHLQLREDPKDRRTFNGNNQRDKAFERGDLTWAADCDREAQKHMGPNIMAMERDGKKTTLGRQNDEIGDRNVARRVIRKKGLKRSIREVGRNVEQAATPARENRGRGAKLGRGVGKVAAKLGSGLLKLVEDLAPALTPEQLEQGQRRQERDDLAADRSQRDRDRGGRGRD